MAGPTTTFQTGVHASLPAASAGCVLYACTTHSKVYRSSGTAWSDWMTIPTGASMGTDPLWDAAGDLAVGTGADTAAKLTKGADGTVLRMASGSVGWGLLPFRGAMAYKAGTQTVTTGAIGALGLDTEEYDTDAIHDNATNNSRMTIPTGMGGKWLFTGSAYAASGLTTAASSIFLRIDGTTDVRGGAQGGIASNAINQAIVTAALSLSAAQYVDLCFYNGTAGTVTIGHASAAGIQTTLSATFLGA